jgi:copper(I)-binding protein
MMRSVPISLRPAVLTVLALLGLLTRGPPGVAMCQAGIVAFPLASTVHAQPPSELVLAEAAGPTAIDAWARASAGAATNGAAYVTLVGGAQPDQLVSVSTPIASMSEVHETIDDNDVMKMRPVPAIPISAGQTVTLAPGAYHIMLMGLKQPLVAGQSFPLTLTFARAAPITLDVQVRAMGGRDQMHAK